jgi:hypothetical protein
LLVLAMNRLRRADINTPTIVATVDAALAAAIAVLVLQAAEAGMVAVASPRSPPIDSRL